MDRTQIVWVEPEDGAGLRPNGVRGVGGVEAGIESAMGGA